jgi:hypothetical protein
MVMVAAKARMAEAVSKNERMFFSLAVSSCEIAASGAQENGNQDDALHLYVLSLPGIG